jgi:uncharacterized protein
MNKPSLVCDTSPLLYLGRLGQTQLLPLLFQPVYMPEQVIMELATGRLLMPDTIDPTKLPWITPVAVTDAEIASLPLHRLGLGECAVLAFAHAHAACWVGLDDRQARLLAQSLGLRVIGLLGILLRAKRSGLVSNVRVLLDSARNQGFRMTPDVYSEALRLAGEL